MTIPIPIIINTSVTCKIEIMQNGDHLLSKIQQDICWAYVIHSSINSYFFAFSTCPINNVLTLDIQVITPEVYRGYVFWKSSYTEPLVCDWMSRVIIYLRLLHGETAPSQLLLLRMHIVRQANDGMFDTLEVQSSPNQSGW